MRKIRLKLSNKRILIPILIALLVIPVVFSLVTKNSLAVTCATIAECEAKKAELEQNKAGYQTEINRLNNESKTLQSTLARLNAEKSVVQSQIDIYQAKYDELTIKIADTEKKISDNKDALGKTIADLYVDDNMSPIEILAGSKNISDFIDKQEYRSSVRNELASTIAVIKQLKTTLEQQKAEVNKVLGDQKNARQALMDKEAEQQSILNSTQGQEAAYQQLSAEADAQLKAYAEEYKNLMRPKNTAVGINDPSKGNYPWGGNNCHIDSNLFSDSDFGGVDPLGYACRQCTSYVAWKILEYTGIGYSYWGNAKMWPNSAVNSGIAVGYTARANSVGVNMSGYYGHVVWVETDPDSQGRIVISQYNSYYDNTGDSSGYGWGNYSKKLVYASEYDRFIYF